MGFPYRSRYAWLVIGLVGCGGSASDESHATLPTEICGASTFTAKLSGAGPLPAGYEVLTEEGWIWVQIDATCEFRTLDAHHSRGFGQGLQGALDDALRQEVEALLSLPRWPELETQYGRSLCDGPDELYTLDEWSVNIISYCHDDWLPEPPDFLRISLIPELLDLLTPYGQPVEGAVRFVLIGPVAEGAGLDYQNAPTWPLPGDPAELAISEAQHAEEGVAPVQVSGSRADALRGLRSAFLAGDIGWRDAAFIPVEQPDGTRYQLFVRDVIE